MPDAVLEHLLAAEYGWTLEYIAQLAPSKFQAHVAICLIKRRLLKVSGEKEQFLAAAAQQMLKTPKKG